MIHYHGGPITPMSAEVAVWKARHAMVSFAHPSQVTLAAEICQSFALDNGAFTMWKQGSVPDWEQYTAWVKQWQNHPSFDFAIVPDLIDGNESDNDKLIAQWLMTWRIPSHKSVAVWHLHESLDRLKYMIHYANNGGWFAVALGSSGIYADPGSLSWWNRMADAMEVCCDGSGRPKCRLHGLRMLDPTICSQLPLASADSTNVARNIGVDSKWENGPYPPSTKAMRALVITDRIESHATAARWNSESRGIQMNFDLIG